MTNLQPLVVDICRVGLPLENEAFRAPHKPRRARIAQHVVAMLGYSAARVHLMVRKNGQYIRRRRWPSIRVLYCTRQHRPPQLLSQANMKKKLETT